MAMMTRYEPFSNMLSLRDAMAQLLEESFVGPFSGTQTTNVMPVDVYEIDDAFVVSAFMPGLSANDLSISVEQGTVTINGEARQDEAPNLRPIVRERPAGAFTRTFTLPVLLDADKVQAELRDGVLNLTLPKAASAKPRKIEIKSN